LASPPPTGAVAVRGPEWGAERLGNLYRSYQLQLEEILQQLGLGSVRELRGRTDLLLYAEGRRAMNRENLVRH